MGTLKYIVVVVELYTHLVVYQRVFNLGVLVRLVRRKTTARRSTKMTLKILGLRILALCKF